MRVRGIRTRIVVAVENASLDYHYTVFIPLSQHRRVIAASYAHRSPNCKLTLTRKACYEISTRANIQRQTTDF
jgi:hypothetical protein